MYMSVRSSHMYADMFSYPLTYKLTSTHILNLYTNLHLLHLFVHFIFHIILSALCTIFVKVVLQQCWCLFLFEFLPIFFCSFCFNFFLFFTFYYEYTRATQTYAHRQMPSAAFKRTEVLLLAHVCIGVSKKINTLRNQ